MPEKSVGVIDLYWIPLGAGGHFVHFNGTVFEAITAVAQRRERSELYHAALIVTTAESPFAIEMTPIPDARGADRGVVLEGPVGSRWAARLRIFRYEIRRWANGVIPDIRYAVASPVRVSGDAGCAQRLLDLVPQVPALVWGRDVLHAHDMWNSNSVVSWLLVSSGVDVASVQPPPGGRAPGWKSGLVAARQRDPCRGATRQLSRQSCVPQMPDALGWPSGGGEPATGEPADRGCSTPPRSRRKGGYSSRMRNT